MSRKFQWSIVDGVINRFFDLSSISINYEQRLYRISLTLISPGKCCTGPTSLH